MVHSLLLCVLAVFSLLGAPLQADDYSVAEALTEAYAFSDGRLIVLHSQASQHRLSRTNTQTQVDYYLSELRPGGDYTNTHFIGSYNSHQEVALAADNTTLFFAHAKENGTNQVIIDSFDVRSLQPKSSSVFRLEKNASPRRILLKPFGKELFVAVESYESNDEGIISGLYLGRVGQVGTLVVPKLRRHIPLKKELGDLETEQVQGLPPENASIADLTAGLKAISQSTTGGRELISDLSLSEVEKGRFEIELISYIPHPRYPELVQRSFVCETECEEMGPPLQCPLFNSLERYLIEPRFNEQGRFVTGEKEVRTLPTPWMQEPVGHLQYTNSQQRYGGILRLSFAPISAESGGWLIRNLFDRGIGIARYDAEGTPWETSSHPPPGMQIVPECGGRIVAEARKSPFGPPTDAP